MYIVLYKEHSKHISEEKKTLFSCKAGGSTNDNVVATCIVSKITNTVKKDLV